jgi:hypothetical protein
MNVTIDEIVQVENRFKRVRLGSFEIDHASVHVLNYSEIIVDHDITKKPRTLRIKLIRPITVALVGGLSIGILVDVMSHEIKGPDGGVISSGDSYRRWAENHGVLDLKR